MAFQTSATGGSAAFLIAASLALSACGGAGESGAEGKGGGRGRQSGPVQVGYVVVQPSNVPMTTELAGRVTAFQTSEVRPQVAGIVRRRAFKEGSIVQAGQTLYQIDPSIYQAQAAQASANLQSARASAEAARVRAERLRPLAEMEAVSRQDYTDAAAQARQAQASVAQNNAQLESARINLRFTRVPAPITGRIGRSLVTEGALVTTNQADPMAVIQRLDPIFVDIQQSSADLLALRRALAADGAVPAAAAVRLKLEDGSDYGQTGTVEFSEVVVNQATGTVTLRARFPNPQGLLLPGMFVRATFAQKIDRQAFLVPQAGLSRDPRGAATIYVVGAGNRAVARTVKADRTVGAFWVVTEGLAPGDKVIVQGLGNLRPDAEIRPVPANTPQRIEAPKGGRRAGGGGESKGAEQRKGG